MEVIGYKCFNEDMTNSYSIKFEIGKIYTVNGPVKFGNQGNGFHMCERMEDTLRYFDAMKNDVSICLVRGSGDMLAFSDEYYGYYDMHVVQSLEILKIFNRDEIINMATNMNRDSLTRFLSGFKLKNDELKYFKDKFKTDDSIINFIEYYQENNFNAFTKKKI